jgi:two-component system NtrC family sensor kinase
MPFSFITFHSMRFKLIASMIAVSVLIGLISLVIGVNLLYRAVLDEANNRVRQDLNVARVIYDNRIDAIRQALTISASMPETVRAVSQGDRVAMDRVISGLSGAIQPDFLSFTDANGRVISRLGGKLSSPSPSAPVNPLALKVIADQRALAGTYVLDPSDLVPENPDLAGKARIPVSGGGDGDNAKALLVGSAVPVRIGNDIAGVIYAGYLLNRDTAIVDKIGETVFRNEIYKGRNVGTATIFQANVRIATSVKDASGRRATGTEASREVTRHVLENGETWTHRARVLDDWYITAYEPLSDIEGDRVGMLYVGVLEAKYADIRRQAITVFTVITVSGVILAIFLGWLITSRIMRPVGHLIRASGEISRGNLSPDIGPMSQDDFGQLQRKFLIMTEALKEREKNQKEESEIRLIQSEKQASVGKLAAGVAHEINNPLTAVLTFTHMVLRRNDLPDEVRSDLETVAAQTERVREIVKSLLDFSRQSALAPEPLDVNRLVGESVGLLENQALIKGVSLTFTGEKDLPLFVLDHNQCLSVLINMLLNALDATSAGGTVHVETMKASIQGEDGVKIVVSDTGTGIKPEYMDRLFDPFFTTKEVGKGTGLGLSVSDGIVQRHGGTITVRSTPGKGAVFTVWLPLHPTVKEGKDRS